MQFKILTNTFNQAHNLSKIPRPQKKKKNFLEEFHPKVNIETNINSSSLKDKDLFSSLKGPATNASKALELLDRALLSRINGYNERLGALVKYGPGYSYAGHWNNSNTDKLTNFIPTATFKPNSVHLLICEELAPLLDAYYRKIYLHALSNFDNSTFKNSIECFAHIRKFFLLCEQSYPDAFNSIQHLHNLLPSHRAISQLHWTRNNNFLQYRNTLSDPIATEDSFIKIFQELDEPQQICFYSTRFKHQLDICDKLIKQPQNTMNSPVFKINAGFPMPIKIEKRMYLESFTIEDDDELESLLIAKQHSEKTNGIFLGNNGIFTTILDTLEVLFPSG